MKSSALPWERAAFIRARAAAGDPALGQHFLKSIEPFVWRRSLDFGVIDDIRQISARIRDHFAQGGRLGPGYDLKRGRGGIREIEFFTQIQQMIHGGRDPSVRAPATLDALDALAKAGRLDPEDAAALAEAYRLLRTVEHRVQMIEDAQTHTVPADSEALDRVARLHGLETGPELLDLLRPHVERAGALFDGLAPETSGRLSNDPDILLGELRTHGLRGPGHGRAAYRRTALGTRAIAALAGRADRIRSDAARLAHAIAAGPDPEHALNRLERHRRAAVERHEPLPAARGAAQAGAVAGQDPRPCAGACPTSWRGGRAARRAVRRVELRSAAAGGGIRGQPR